MRSTYQSAEYEDLNDALQSALITKHGSKENKAALKDLLTALQQDVDPNLVHNHDLDAIGSISRRNDFDTETVKDVLRILFDAGLKLKPENLGPSIESVNSIENILNPELFNFVVAQNQAPHDLPNKTVNKDGSHFIDRIIPPSVRHF